MKTDRVLSVNLAPLAGSAIAIAIAMFATSLALPAAAQTAAAAPAASAAKPATAKQPLFAAPGAGFEALIGALRAKDAKQISRLLGPGHQRVIDSGDSEADRAVWAAFVADYDAKHAVQLEGDAKATLLTGVNDWPMPIPLVKSAGGWAFDANQGEEEIISRRIGRNELDTIQTCLAFIDMQREYAEVDRNGDGLYWPTQEGEAPSPGGPRLAAADPKGKTRGGPVPYHGYYYRMLTAQGKDAPGGARSYVANGKLIGGIALVAYPARYLSSGVKTFTCNMDAIVYEKDLGTETAALAAKITAFNPDPSWTRTK